MIWTLKTDKLLFCWHLKWRLKNVFFNSRRSRRDLFETQFPHKMHFFHPTFKQPQIMFMFMFMFMFKVKYVDSIMMLVRLDLNLIVSLFQHKCEVSETVSTTTLRQSMILINLKCLSLALVLELTFDKYGNDNSNRVIQT